QTIRAFFGRYGRVERIFLKLVRRFRQLTVVDVLLHERQEHRQPTEAGRIGVARMTGLTRDELRGSKRKRFARIMVILQRNRDLLRVVNANVLLRSLTRLSERRRQKAGQGDSE